MSYSMAEENKLNIRLHLYDTDMAVKINRDDEELYRLLSQLEIPENTAAGGAQWLLDTKGGFCRVIYSINKAQDKIFRAGINVTLDDSEADYREMMKQSQQNRETNRREQLASMAQ